MNLVFLLNFLKLVDDKRKIFHLPEYVVLKKLIVMVQLVFHLLIGLVIILLKDLPLLVLILHVAVQVLQIVIDVLLSLPLQS